jgi:hypothetical protein
MNNSGDKINKENSKIGKLGILGYTGKVVFGLGLVDFLQSLYTGRHFYEMINPSSTADMIRFMGQNASDLIGLGIDAVAMSMGGFFYNSGRVNKLEQKLDTLEKKLNEYQR